MLVTVVILLHAYCGRYWEALHKWDEALQLTPNDETLHEMRAQVRSILKNNISESVKCL